ncbi:hypothetical protein MPSI1_003006 [Malassezia psittaci]|uniref:Cation-transporting ATPase n=1 Tax=Malassezia psittaci TaxID=1821823 RepID=A0AAF0JFF2_9BASI|nr:hypothetical protein MPSI1_003006 [Malassezia psittaci]
MTPSRPRYRRTSSSASTASFFDPDELKEAQNWQSHHAENDKQAGVPVRRRRRDSQVGSYDDRNAIFDGPAAEFVPSSVSRNRHANRADGNPDASLASEQSQSNASHTASGISYRKRSYIRPSSSVPRADDSLAGAQAHGGTPSLLGSFFTRTRPGNEREAWDESISDSNAWSEHASSASSHSSDSEHSPSDDSQSSTSSLRRDSPSRMIPNVFGTDEGYDESRVEREEQNDSPFDDPGLGSKPVHLKDFPEGIPSLLGNEQDASALHVNAEGPTLEDMQRSTPWLDKRRTDKQQIYLSDEDTLIRITGYTVLPYRMLIYYIVCVLSLGIVALLLLWFPKYRLKYLMQEVSFSDADFIVVENQWGDLNEEKFILIPFARPLRSVFPPSSRDPPCTHAQYQAQLLEPVDDEVNPGSESEQMIDLRMFEYRYTRFILHPPSGRFRTMQDWRDSQWTSVAAMRQGIRSDAESERQAIFGANLIEIASKSSMELLVSEVLHPFYVFQLVSIGLWSLDDYYYYAFCIAAISVGSILSTLFETKKTIRRMREMNRFVCSVRVLRDGQWTRVESSELVPGDVYDAADPQLSVLPADSVLLTGDAIVNESMLTGESVPISKIPVSEAAVHALQSTRNDLSAQLARHFLFAGTKVIRIRPVAGAEETSAKALVLRTGFNTTKGSLVRGMLFPKPMGFKFYRDSFRFIGFLACIALVGLCLNTINFIKLGIAWSTLLIRVLDLVTVVVPPALPATMSIGTAFAIVRLRRQGVFCISPTRVNMGGKVNVVCFDKTGTLTEDGLDVLGTRTIAPDMQFSELYETNDAMVSHEFHSLSTTQSTDDAVPSLTLLYALATCHSLKVVNGEVIGDPLDIKMFDFTQWHIDETDHLQSDAEHLDPTPNGPERAPALVQTVVRPPEHDGLQLVSPMQELELGVIRTFDFVSSLRRMSVIVKRLQSQSMEIYVKGAPEALVGICDPSTLPDDFEDLLSYYTQHGYRVIACAGKSVPNMSWVEAQRISRERAESQLTFLGLIVFENKLKPGSAPAIATLRHANIGCKMVTGDNPRTAVSVARECGILGHSTNVFLASFVRGSPEQPADVQLEWTSTDDERMHLNPDTLKPQDLDPLANEIGDLRVMDYELVVTGDVFRWMTDYAPIDLVRRMLIKGTIFARMSPDEKHDLVDRLQELGYTVAMCGDGANDCGALKAADIGISLSEAEASVAAPFTSTRPDISCVIEVIKEGRAALVTSFSCFKYMALYSLIQFTSITILYNLASSLGDFQFLYIDLFIILPVAVAMARTLPYPTLHVKRPTANLVSKKVLLSMFAQVIICSLAQVFTFWLTRRQSWYEPPKVNPDHLNVVSAENSAIFLVSSFQYVTVAAVFSVGPPFRMPIYTNPMLLLSLSALALLSTYFLFVQSGFFYDLLGLVHFPWKFHWELLAIVLINTLACLVFESYLMSPALQLVKFLIRIVHRSRRHDKARKHSQKTYKMVISSLNDPAEA